MSLSLYHTLHFWGCVWFENARQFALGTFETKFYQQTSQVLKIKLRSLRIEPLQCPILTQKETHTKCDCLELNTSTLYILPPTLIHVSSGYQIYLQKQGFPQCSPLHCFHDFSMPINFPGLFSQVFEILSDAQILCFYY